MIMHGNSIMEIPQQMFSRTQNFLQELRNVLVYMGSLIKNVVNFKKKYSLIVMHENNNTSRLCFLD